MWFAALFLDGDGEPDEAFDVEVDTRKQPQIHFDWVERNSGWKRALIKEICLFELGGGELSYSGILPRRLWMWNPRDD